MRNISLFILFLLWSGTVGAQVFDPVSDVGTKTRTDISSPQDSQTVETKTAEDIEDVPNDAAYIPAEINFNEEPEDEKDNEKKYDNTVGKITEFKIVNGKLKMADPNDRKILVYAENYKVEKGFDGIVRCSMRIYVLNDLTERINSFGFKLIWPEISTAIQMQKVNPGVRTYSDVMLLGNGCFTMDKTPTLEINRCRVKGKSQEQCANAVRWFQKDK